MRLRRPALLLSTAVLAGLLLAGVAAATHPRVGGGTPFRVPLIPAYKACTSANAVHTSVGGGTPVSCAPPQQESSTLTTGATGAALGQVRIDVFCTDGSVLPCTPATSSDQEDVRVNASLTDVRCRVVIPGCSAIDADFTGELLFRHGWRLTDHANGPTNPGSNCSTPSGAAPCVTATSEDFDFRIPIQCVDNGGANGANCNIATTLDTFFLPGLVAEQQRALRTLSQIEVLDPGPDGIVNNNGTGDEQIFERMGYFTP